MRFLKTTVIGGLLFLLPIIILVAVLGKAHAIMVRLSAPLAAWMPVDRIGGVALANLIGVLAIIVVCFVAGLAARSSFAARTIESLESKFLSAIPGYGFIKGMIVGFGGESGEDELKPVLAKFDDAWQVAFEVERGADGQVVVYLPGAPDPWSGAVLVMTEDRIERLDMALAAAVKNIRAIGRGTTKLIRSRPTSEQ
jgi:uncharacterized membrane protein